MKEGDKLYIVVRADLKAGQQSVQAQHSLIEFVFQHPEIIKNWYEASNYLCMLQIKDEYELIELSKQASSLQIKFSMFREPDLNNSTTAICFEPGEKTKKLCSNLELALNDTQQQFNK